VSLRPERWNTPNVLKNSHIDTEVDLKQLVFVVSWFHIIET